MNTTEVKDIPAARVGWAFAQLIDYKRLSVVCWAKAAAYPMPIWGEKCRFGFFMLAFKASSKHGLLICDNISATA